MVVRKFECVHVRDFLPPWCLRMRQSPASVTLSWLTVADSNLNFEWMTVHRDFLGTHQAANLLKKFGVAHTFELECADETLVSAQVRLIVRVTLT